MLLHLHKRTRIAWAIFSAGLVMFSLLLSACSNEVTQKTYTIGVVSEFPADTILSGFKAEMAQLGYVEGKNITYIYHQPVGTNPQANSIEINSLVEQKVDVLLTLGIEPSLAAKKAVDGTDIPVVFAPVMNPVAGGVVTSISHPGGNLTGIQMLNSIPKALEWLLKIAPDTKRVYVPYNPADQVAVISTKSLPDVAAKLGVELVLDKFSSGDEELAAIRAYPKDSAILFVISPSLTSSMKEASKLAADLHIQTAGTTEDIEDTALLCYMVDMPQTGKQAARLVDKIFKGSKPGNLPVETAKFSLSINLKVAEAIGLHIPDEILKQANNIIH